MIKKMGIVVLAVMLLAIFSGCITEMSADQIVQNMKEKQESIKDFSATMTLTASFGGQNMTAKAKIMNKMPDKIRIEYLEPAVMAGGLMVSDGTTSWTYDPKTNTTIKLPAQKTGEDFKLNYVKSVREFLNETKITYLGTETLDGRTVYRIKASPKNDSILTELNSNMLVDSETWMPLMIEISDKNNTPIISMEYSDVKFNTGIPDSQFEFNVAQGTTVIQ
ncbi:Outer-membrane lipoprotein carrier protein [uncultured archaeon]|nr:Outer-membrane lipoprotein carrier protein [uncultured archaeon]